VDYFIYTFDLVDGFSMTTLLEMGREYGGIRIYRDGFRVLPYGEPRDDWLRLAADTGRRSLLVPANNHNFFGQVELSSAENVLLEDTSSREGLIENDAYGELAEFVRSGVEWAAMRIAANRERKQTASQRNYRSPEKKPSQRLKEIFQSAAKSGSTEEPGGHGLINTDEIEEEILQIVETFEEEQTKRDSEHLRYEEMLRILASLGTSIAVFSHEIRGALSGFNNAVTRLKMLLARINAVEAAADQMTDIDVGLGKLKDVASYVMSLIAHTASRERSELALHGEIHEFVSQFRHYLDARGVEFDVDVDPNSLRTAPMHRSEIHSVLFNFLTNAIKAMDRASTGVRKIKITARQVDGRVCIGFQDTGDGVTPENADRIFDAFFTTHQYGDDQLAGPGSGLGLKIVRDIAHANGGDVCLSPAEYGYTTRFDFLVPAAGAH
jgi:signal transduction histidine kinase